MTDEQLASRAREGGSDALETLARRHHSRMRSWALYAMGETSAAEDVTQEALVRLVRFISRYDPSRPFLPWLRSLIRSAAADHRRTGVRLARAIPEFERPPAMERVLDLERAAVRAVEAFSNLTPRQREAMILCDRRGMKAGEAAKEMGIEAATVRALTHQARRAVRAVLLSQAPDLHDLVRDA